MDCYQYIQCVDTFLAKEEKNADEFYQKATKKKVLDIVLQKVLINQAEKLTMMPTGCKYMFEQGKSDELKMMFNVFKGAPRCTDYIMVCMNDFIQMEGTKIVSSPENLKDPIKFTLELLNFK